MELVFCVGEEGEGELCEQTRDRREECPAGLLWLEIGEKISDLFQKTTIADLCHSAERLGVERKLDFRFMYYI